MFFAHFYSSKVNDKLLNPNRCPNNKNKQKLHCPFPVRSC